MANFIISPYAVSFNSIKNALETYINDKSDVTDTWSDFYTAGAGQTVLELDAAIASFYAFHFILGRREAYLPVAQNYSSILGGAQSLGYNASRGHNLHFNITITPNQTQTLTKWTVLGSYAEYDIILWEDVILTQGENITLPCVLGNSNVQSFAIKSNEIQQFTFTADDTTDDVRLILTDKEVPFATELKEAMEDKYIMLSNSYGSVDVFYLNQGNHNYKIGDTLYLQYIQRNNIQYNQITTDDITLDYGTIVSTEVLFEREDVQDKESIKASASIYHEMNNVVRARKDYAKYLLQDNELNLVDTNDLDINPGLIALTYLRKDGSRLTDNEKFAFLEKIGKVTPDGVAEAFIVDPIPVIRTLSITLWQKSGEVIPADINDYIQEIFDDYRHQLALTLDFEEIEHKLEQIPGVKIARIDIGAKEYNANTKYKLYDIIQVEDIPVGTELETWNLICSKIQTQTGSYDPDWASAQNIGDEVTDSNLVWRNSDAYINSVARKWKAKGDFSMYDDIAVSYDIYPNATTSIMPNWDPTTVIDGNVTFNKIKTYDYLLDQWREQGDFDLGEYVQFNRGDERAVYKVVDLLAKTGVEAPDWSQCQNEEDTITDAAITWSLRYKGMIPSQDYLPGKVIAYTQGGKIYIYKCVKACNKDTYYSNTKKKATQELPFDTTQEIKEWIEVDTNETITEQTGVDSENNPIYTTTVITEWVEGDTIWYLEDVLDSYATWQAETEMGLSTYIQANNNIFYSIDISNAQTGDDWFSELVIWPETYTDNNIVWQKDYVETPKQTYDIAGTCWLPETAYSLDDVIIVDNGEYTYAYNVSYTNDRLIRTDANIYTVASYCGTTSDTEPTWGADNVEDNEILWTKTDIASEDEWTANTTYKFGKIITTEQGNYMFTCVLGTSGSRVNWLGIKNGFVKDNNITWRKLNDSTVMSLQWNEYLDLNYELTRIN